MGRAAGDDNAVALLEETLEEEGAADEKLTELALSGLNEAADEKKGMRTMTTRRTTKTTKTRESVEKK
jgi:hypothetical protein